MPSCYLDGAWVKATAVFDKTSASASASDAIRSTASAIAHVPTLDGRHDGPPFRHLSTMRRRDSRL